jgi:hypothetical protein
LHRTRTLLDKNRWLGVRSTQPLEDVISMNRDNDSIKGLAYDGFVEYLNKPQIILNVSWTARPIFGKIVHYDEDFVVLEKKDGHRQTIKRSAVLSIDTPRSI